MQVGPLHENLRPLSFLVGKWRSISAKGFYPTIEPFTYHEEVEFTSYGQPMLNYTSKTWHPIKNNPMHLESGFLRIKPRTNHLAFMVAHNFGLTSLEEGTIVDQEIHLKSTQISRMDFAKDPAVVEIVRSYKMIGDVEKPRLEMSLSMATIATPLTEHLSVMYEKVLQ